MEKRKMGVIELLKKSYRIVDEKGQIIESGFRCKEVAKRIIKSYRLNKQDKLFVEEEWNVVLFAIPQDSQKAKKESLVKDVVM